ncbi:hypothetical protein LLG46_08125 [bacterium]|nr:hypothetical protein [bacterium]
MESHPRVISKLVCILFILVSVGTISLRINADQIQNPKVKQQEAITFENGKQLDPEALLIIINSWGNSWKIGPGFVFGDGRYLVASCEYIVQSHRYNNFTGLSNPYVISPYLGDICEARIVAIYPKLDVAILKLPWTKHPAFSLAKEQEILDTDRVLISFYNTKKVRMESELDLCTDKLTVTAVGVKHGQPLMLWMRDTSQEVESVWPGSPVISSNTGNMVGIFHTRAHSQKLGYTTAIGTCTANQLAAITRKINEPKNYRPLQSSTENSKEAFLNIIHYFTVSTLNDQLSCAKELVKLRPFSAYAHMLLAQSAFYNDQMDLAWQHYKKALTLGPCEAGIHFSYARFLESSRPKDAVIEYKKAFALNPRDIEGLRDCLSLLIKLGRKSEAESYAHQAALRQPSIAEIQSAYSDVMKQYANPGEIK